jgi:hypothetical protein
MDFLSGVWKTLMGEKKEEAVSTPKRPVTKSAVTVRRTQKTKPAVTPKPAESPKPAVTPKPAESPKPAVTPKPAESPKHTESPMPALTLKKESPKHTESPKHAVTRTNTKSRYMSAQVNKKSSHLTALALLEKNRKNRHTLKQGHKAKTATNN